MKALTIHQPWASALAHGLKKFETRGRISHHRGPLALHAGRKMDEEALERLSGVPWTTSMVVPLSRRWGSPDPGDFVSGAIIAIGEMTDCIEMTEEFIAAQNVNEIALGFWEPGRFAYQIENVKLIDPVPIGGKQGFWEWDENSSG